MDPITHTLSGVAVAQVLPIEEHRAIATLTVALAANLPDVDALVRRLKSTAFIEYHRVATHSLLGMVVLALLFSAVWAPVTGLTFLTVVFLSLLGCITHTAVDLLIHSDGVPLLYAFVEHSKNADTVRPLLQRSLHPHATAEACKEGVLVKWKDLAYAFDGSVDPLTARLLYSSAGDLLSEEFRERW